MGNNKTDITETKSMEKSRKSAKLADFLVSTSDTELPTYPSAQLWFSMTTKEKNSLREAVKKAGVDWEDYESDMMKHFPRPK
jgi:hypothetical protein